MGRPGIIPKLLLQICLTFMESTSSSTSLFNNIPNIYSTIQNFHQYPYPLQLPSKHRFDQRFYILSYIEFWDSNLALKLYLLSWSKHILVTNIYCTIKFKMKQQPHFLPVFELMSDSLTTLKVEPYQCPSHESILLTQGPIHENFMKKYWELAELENEVFLRRPFWIF